LDPMNDLNTFEKSTSTLVIKGKTGN